MKQGTAGNQEQAKLQNESPPAKIDIKMSVVVEYTTTGLFACQHIQGLREKTAVFITA